MGLLDGKHAIVTGAGQGIGKAIALRLAQEGAGVTICDINPETARATAKEIESLGTQCIAIAGNISQQAEVADMVKQTLEAFGKIDILVNNAGITRDTLLMRMKEEDWDAVISVNLKSAFLCCKEVVRSMMKARQGRIVNIASVIGLMGNAGQANYAASKAGMIALTKSLAKELAPRNVLVNAVAPGFIQTAMTDKLPDSEKEKILGVVPLGKMGTPDDVASTVLYLSCDLSSYVTGKVIAVDGGLVM